MIIRSFPLPGAHDLVSVAGAELSPSPTTAKAICGWEMGEEEMV